MSNIIKGEPTKEFFIHMLTKDIKLERSIIDLIDNSIDGAKRIIEDDSYKGLYIHINISPDSFVIKDNCGGFSLHIASQYAFRFGRVADNNENDVANSIGRFGVGMKRALFKIGESFEVESKSEEDHFQVKTKVSEWSKINGWDFEYSLITSSNNLATNGTYISVVNLNSDVKQEFSSAPFINGLINEIERTLNFYLNKGLEIKVNDTTLMKKDFNFLTYDKLKPYSLIKTVKGVDIKIFAGLDSSNLDYAGWYIYCNDRLVLERDKSNLTGWDGKKIEGNKIGKFHHSFAMFRGVVFFDSVDAKKLPLTTTKTGIDTNSEIYKIARGYMQDAMLQVMNFLRKIESEDQRNDIINNSKPVNVIEIKSKVYEAKFISPELNDIENNDTHQTSVSFKAMKNDVESAKTFFSVTTNGEAGRKAFDYFIKAESTNL
jgi:hypothetical protein